MVYISNDLLTGLLPKWFFVGIGIIFIMWGIIMYIKYLIKKIKVNREL